MKRGPPVDEFSLRNAKAYHVSPGSGLGLICPNALCRILTLVLYDVDAANNAKSSTYDKESPLGRLICRDAT